MDIFCQKCQKRVGRVADEKIPVGQKASVKCPVCGEKIVLVRAEPPAAPGITRACVQPLVPPLPPMDVGSRPAVTPSNPPNLDFTIRAILKEAWQKTSGAKGPIWGAGLMIFLVLVLAGCGIAMVSRMFELGTGAAALSMALQITLTAAIYPLMAGVMMIGIKRSVGLPVSWKMAFGYFAYLLPIVVAAFLMTLLTTVGFAFLILPGLYLSLAYSLTIPLIVDKDMGPWQAMETSRKAIHKHWFKIFGLYCVMALIYLTSLIPLGLGLIWTVPMLVMVSAILYRELFGVNEKP